MLLDKLFLYKTAAGVGKPGPNKRGTFPIGKTNHKTSTNSPEGNSSSLADSKKSNPTTPNHKLSKTTGGYKSSTGAGEEMPNTSGNNNGLSNDLKQNKN